LIKSCSTTTGKGKSIALGESTTSDAHGLIRTGRPREGIPQSGQHLGGECRRAGSGLPSREIFCLEVTRKSQSSDSQPASNNGLEVIRKPRTERASPISEKQHLEEKRKKCRALRERARGRSELKSATDAQKKCGGGSSCRLRISMGGGGLRPYDPDVHVKR